VRAPAARLILLALAASLVTALPATAADRDPNQAFFPVQVVDGMNYTDSYGDCRSGCSRSHLGVDIMAPQMTPVFAAADGVVYDADGTCEVGQACSAYALLVDGYDGRMYFYVHLNNDTPGRPNGCDRAGGMDNAFAPALVDHYRAHGTMNGYRVTRGEHLGYVGSSGNAGCRVDHLHFEIWQGEGWSGHGWGQGSMNPYPIVKAAQDAGNVWGPEWPGVPTARIAGADRILTAVELSRTAFDRAQSVVIAPATQYQEALMAAPLAAALGGPVLLAWPSGEGAVNDELAAEVNRLGAEYAVLVGNTDRLGAEVAEQLAARTNLAAGNIRRLSGPDVATLSANVAEMVLAAHGIAPPAKSTASASPSPEPTEDEADGSDDLRDLLPLMSAKTQASADGGTAAVAPLLAAGSHPSGLGWPDALAASLLGARQVAPVLLTPYDRLHPEVARILESDGIEEVRIVGGTSAVSSDTEAAVVELGRSVRRLAGADRYETALAVAAEVIADGAQLARVALATGLDFPDALAAGPSLADVDRPLVLVHRDVTVDVVQRWLRERSGNIDALDVIGGTNAVTDRVVNAAAIAANNG
jgi:putative cell wall-binding protein